ncbi:MAG: response regulator [Pseudomonadota bacterium]
MTADPIRLLLLEDDPADARLVQTMLRRLPGEPFAVTVVNRLSAAVEHLAAGCCEVVLADLSLPDSAGLATLEALTAAAPNVPVLVLTGNDDDRLALDALKQGAQDYLVKGRGDASMLMRLIRYAIERKAAERALKEARDRAEAAARAKSVFLAMVGHEIRTPLNGILGMTRLLLETSLDVRQRTFAETVASSGELLLGLVNDILDFSRLEAEGLTLSALPFDLIDTVEELRLMLAPRAADKGLTLGSRFGPDVPRHVVGDPLRLRQVLLNLVGNAIKFTDSGGVLVQVVVVGEPAPRLRFAVSDTGIGIPDAARADLFTEFSQGDDSITRRFGGAGLGLAICKRLVTLMGGEIGYDSRPGEGSTFWFTLPLAVADEAGPAAEQAPVDVPPARVLLVDDNQVNLEVAAGLLERHGHRVTRVESGPAAVAAMEAEAGGFDLVLLDMHMPEMDGIETARRLHAVGAAAASVPIYLLTANPVEQDARAWREAGIAGCLAKPFRVEEVVRLLAEPRTAVWARGKGGQELLALADLLADLKDLGRERMAGFVDLFRRSASEDLEKATRLALAGELHDLAPVAHRMASAAASLHLAALAERCRAIETAARRGDPEAASLAADLPMLWESSVRALAEVVT